MVILVRPETGDCVKLLSLPNSIQYPGHFLFRVFNSRHDVHLRGSENCRSLCSEDCFKILDSATTSFQLKIKEAMHILWEQPSLNSQVKHLNLSLSLVSSLLNSK